MAFVFPAASAPPASWLLSMVHVNGVSVVTFVPTRYWNVITRLVQKFAFVSAVVPNGAMTAHNCIRCVAANPCTMLVEVPIVSVEPFVQLSANASVEIRGLSVWPIAGSAIATSTANPTSTRALIFLIVFMSLLSAFCFLL